MGVADRKKRRWMILASFLALFGGGLVVYGVAWGRPKADDDQKARRHRMVERQIARRGVKDPRVLSAMRAVPRHEFVPPSHREDAYEDRPLPIGFEQTISQPYIVAAMTELLDPEPGDRVLEVGTGSGYQAAVLAELVDHVYTVEIVPELAARAKATLKRLGYDNITAWAGDGYAGDPKHAPFDGIIVTAAPEEVPPPLLEQLKVGARLVIPVGGADQALKVYQRKKDGSIDARSVFGVRFVPMTGEIQKRD